MANLTEHQELSCVCAVELTAKLVGDKWTLLIIRDLAGGLVNTMVRVPGHTADSAPFGRANRAMQDIPAIGPRDQMALFQRRGQAHILHCKIDVGA